MEYSGCSNRPRERGAEEERSKQSRASCVTQTVGGDIMQDVESEIR